MCSMKIFFSSFTDLEIFKNLEQKRLSFFSMSTFPNSLNLEIYGNECWVWPFQRFNEGEWSLDSHSKQTEKRLS